MATRTVRRLAAAVTTAALLAAGCTSSTANRPEAVDIAEGEPAPTASVDDPATAFEGGDGPGDEVGPGTATGDGGATATGGSSDGTQATSGTTGGTDGSSTATTGDGGTDAGAATGDATTDGSTGEPAPAAPIKIGAVIPTGDPGAAFGVEGGENDAGALERVVRAVAERINETGGLAGRQIELVVEGVDNTDQNQDNQIRTHTEACIKMTEDHKVFMVLDFGATFWAQACYVEHRTPLLSLGVANREESMRDFRPWLLPTFGINEDRNARLVVRALEEQGRATTKMGLISFDHPDTKKPAKQWIVPGVASIGGEVIEEVYLPITYADLAAGLANAVLKFKQRGIDNVIVWGCCGGGIWLLFAESAEGADYHPAYTISTYDGAGLLVPLLPEGQRNDIAGHGWSEALDIMSKDQSPLNEREAACLEDVNQRLGTDYDDRTDGTTSAALAACDEFGVTQVALRPATGRTLTVEDVAPLFYDVGDYLPTRFPGANFNATSFDALSSYRLMEYGQDCGCMRYTSEVRRFPW
ncbi:MAG TPA: ABC transporter substrate-binding protein [Nitriliruptorales bacterium]